MGHLKSHGLNRKHSYVHKVKRATIRGYRRRKTVRKKSKRLIKVGRGKIT